MSLYLRSLLIAFFGLVLILIVAGLAMVAGVYWNIESWPIFVSILIGTGMFFAGKKSFGEYKKIYNK